MFGFGKLESRKFIDLLLEATNNKWTNIDASKRLKAGDYGTVERSTGEFLVEGNLYELAPTAMAMYPPEIGAPTQFELYSSRGVKELGVFPSVSAGLDPVVDLEFSGKWQFNRRRGALLVLVKPRVEYIRGFPVALLKDENLQPILKNRVICTEVVSCPGFCLYLGNSQEHVFDLSLKADLPVPVAVPLKVGAGIGANWKFGNTQGIIKQGLDPQGNNVFFPLFSLKGVQWGRVSSVTRGEDGEELLQNPETPWKWLNEEGQEINFPEDTELDEL